MEIIIRLADMVAIRFPSQQFRIIETRMNRPPAQTGRQRAEELSVTVRLMDRVERKAVRQIVTVGRQIQALHLLDKRPPGDTERKTILLCQPEPQSPPICFAIEMQSMPVRVGRLEPCRQHGFDLRPELDFGLN